MNVSCQIRTDNGKLCGYAAEKDGTKYFALFDAKENFLGSIEAKDLYIRLENGPCIDLDRQYK